MNGGRSSGGEGGFRRGEREGDGTRTDGAVPRAGRAGTVNSGRGGAGGDPLPGVRPGPGAVLAAAVRDAAVDPEAEKRALVAFRKARDEGALGAARTRRQDDWRPAGERRRGRAPRETPVAPVAGGPPGGAAADGSAAGTPVQGADGGEGSERAEEGRPRPSSGLPAAAGIGADLPGPSGPSCASVPGPSGPSCASVPGPSDGPGGSSGRPSSVQNTEAGRRADLSGVEERR